ncbi:Uncharacterized protein FWK35_00033897 [Aphis craccivora]|uniref:Uncharacterized protein n=1 Tax=Aphis craccivora TaxID=307492 RepID=A0A6G0VW24_APHCR|nr:Uncharacterized protein FWK35_00033897 [Aphis craccivora]
MLDYNLKIEYKISYKLFLLSNFYEICHKCEKLQRKLECHYRKKCYEWLNFKFLRHRLLLTERYQSMGVVSCSKMNLVGTLRRSFFEFPNSFQKRREKPKKN